MTLSMITAGVVFAAALAFHRATPAATPGRWPFLVDVALSTAAALVAGAGTAIFQMGVP